MSKPGNPEFWSDVKKVGRNLSLISKEEAKEQGGLSSISDDEAEKVRFNLPGSKVMAANSSLLSVYFLNNGTRFVIERYPIFLLYDLLSSETTNGL